MTHKTDSVIVLGVEIPFKPGTDMNRVNSAVRLVEDRFANQQIKSRTLTSKNIILTYLVLGLADELLQAEKKQENMQAEIVKLLDKIDKSLK